MKKSLFRENARFFHINVEFFSYPIFKELDWIFIQKTVNLLVQDHEAGLHALIMMDTHIHLLLQSNQQKENYFCEALKEKLQRPGATIESHCEPITSYPQFLNTYKYIYRNSVEAGLVRKVEDYRYSSLQGLLGKSVSYCTVIDHMGLIQNPFHHLNWLNNFADYQFSKLKQFSPDSISH